VPLLYHFLSGPAVFQADLVQSIDFYPGNFPVAFGRKQAGVVTARTKDEEPGEQLHGMASLDLLDFEALLRIPLGPDSQIAIAGRRSHFGALLPLVVPLFTDNKDALGVSPRYWDYQIIGTDQARRLLAGQGDGVRLLRRPGLFLRPETQNDPAAAVRRPWASGFTGSTPLCTGPSATTASWSSRSRRAGTTS